MTSEQEPMNDVVRDITPDGLSGERMPSDVTADVAVAPTDDEQPVEAPDDVRPGPR